MRDRRDCELVKLQTYVVIAAIFVGSSCSKGISTDPVLTGTKDKSQPVILCCIHTNVLTNIITIINE